MACRGEQTAGERGLRIGEDGARFALFDDGNLTPHLELAHHPIHDGNDYDQYIGDAALKASAAQPGDKVIDVGCGCGDTSIELAQMVGKSGTVLGIDVSVPMLEAARSRAADMDCPHLVFREGDASETTLPVNNDLVFSRFGAMFFSEPTQAFSHLRGSLRVGGRCVFVCWRSPHDNPWATVPLSAARLAIGATPPPADPNAPGGYAFADEVRLKKILLDAGYQAVHMQRFDIPVFLGATPRLAAEASAQVGAVARFVREAGTEHLPVILEAVESALLPLAAPDGEVSLNGSTWIVSATNPE